MLSINDTSDSDAILSVLTALLIVIPYYQLTALLMVNQFDQLRALVRLTPVDNTWHTDIYRWTQVLCWHSVASRLRHCGNPAKYFSGSIYKWKSSAYVRRKWERPVFSKNRCGLFCCCCFCRRSDQALSVWHFTFGQLLIARPINRCDCLRKGLHLLLWLEWA